MKIYTFFILGVFFVNGNVNAQTLFFSHINGSITVSMSKEQILESEKQRVEIARKNYKPYECNHFKVGDKVTYSVYYVLFERTDFVGTVTKIEPKLTNEYIHLITVKRLSGEGESGTYSEQFLEQYKIGD